MAKDAKGHGSDKRGGGKAVVSVDPSKIGFRIADIGPGGTEHNVKTDTAWDKAHGGADRAAAGTLGQGHSKSDPVPVHLNAWGQTPSTAKAVRSQLRMDRKMQLNKPPSKRRSYP